MKSLKGKIAIITGGAKGIGHATATLFLQEEASVVIWDIDAEAGAAAVKHWQAQSYDGRFDRVDTTKLFEVEQATQRVIDHYGQIDILINNAGITRDASMKKMNEQQWQQVLDVNLTGVFNCTKAITPHMVERRYGRIVNASSVVALYGNFGQTNYAATKAGVIGMTKVWAKEFGPKGITVNAVAPGFIATDMVEAIPPEYLKGLEEKTPLRRMGKASDVANAYLFLASEEAAFITGACLSVDGGLTI
ncbi:MAG TPA: 3-oxoacyl-ACP reductase FabG [Saprospiraceae bacterium]|nr:3-oxoacyl-ACP reductase FabG [Saprospiraceae bacterium]